MTIGKTSPMDQTVSDSDHTAVKGAERCKTLSGRDTGPCSAWVRVSSLGPMQRPRTTHSHRPSSCGSALRSDPPTPRPAARCAPAWNLQADSGHWWNLFCGRETQALRACQPWTLDCPQRLSATVVLAVWPPPPQP